MSSILARVAWLPFAYAVLLHPSAAQTQMQAPAQSQKKRLPAPLSKQELRACVQQEHELNKRQDALTLAQVQHNSQLAEASQQARILAEQLRKLDNTDEDAVDAYNKRNDARNLEVDKLNKNADALNLKITALQTDSADHMEKCSSRPFLRADREVILKELGLPATPPKPQLPPQPAQPGARVTDA
jgi:predicted transcriptional regulator